MCSFGIENVVELGPVVLKESSSGRIKEQDESLEIIVTIVTWTIIKQLYLLVDRRDW